MDDIVKVCKIHGNLKNNQVRREKNKEILSGKYIRCIECKKINDRNSRLKNKEKIKKKKKEYINGSGKENDKKHKKKYYQKDKTKKLMRKLGKIHDKKSVLNLTDRYIKKLIKGKEKSFSAMMIPSKLISLKKIVILLNKEIKEIKKWT